MRNLRSVLALAGLVLASGALAQSITPGANRNAPSPGSFAPPPASPVAQGTAPVPQAAPAQPAAAQAADAPKHTRAEVERKGRAGMDTFLGTYLTLSRDCKVGVNPEITFTSAPANGTTKLRTYPINLRDVPGAPRRNCIGTSPRGVAAVYRANSRFHGEDNLVFKVTYPNGDTREVAVKITVK